MSSSAEIDKYLEWCKGNEAAVGLISMLGQVSQIADDFVDRDKPRNGEDMTTLLSLCLVEIPENPFYQAYSSWLRPIFTASLAQWNASNAWAKGTEQEKVYGFVYRETLEIVIPLVASLIGGRDHGLEVAKEVNSFYHQPGGKGYDDETFADWCQEQEKCPLAVVEAKHQHSK